MTSIGVTRHPDPTDSVGQLLDWKGQSEGLVRASGSPYTIVRPGWFDNVGPGDDRLVFEQGDTGNGGIGRDQLAEVLVRSFARRSSVDHRGRKPLRDLLVGRAKSSTDELLGLDAPV